MTGTELDWQADAALRKPDQPIAKLIQRRVKDCLEMGSFIGRAFRQKGQRTKTSSISDASRNGMMGQEDGPGPTLLTEEDLDDPELLSAAAAEIYRMRRARDHLLPKNLTGEPAWDMLLALYSEAGVRVTLSSLCHSAGVPQSTSLRWIGMLEHDRLVTRVEHPRDPRIILIALTEEGRALVERVLKAMLRAFSL